MNKFLKWMFLLVLMGMVGTTQAQFVYFCDFEDPNDASEWSFNNSANSINEWYIGSGTATVSGGKSIYVSNNNGDFAYSNNVSGVSLISTYHELEMDETGYYTFSYDWRCFGESVYDYMRIALIPTSMEIPTTSPSSFHISLPEGWIAIDQGSKMNAYSEWKHENKEVYLTEGSYNLVLFWRNDGSVNNGVPSAVDNIQIKKKCSPPNQFFVYDQRSDGFAIRWHGNSNCLSWDIEYGPTGFSRSNGEGTLVSNIDTTNYIFTNLDENTSYDIYFKSNCAGSDVSVDTMITVSTIQTHFQLPYYQKFIDFEIPDSWILQSGNVRTTDFSLVFEYNSCLVLPKMAVPEWGVSFRLDGGSIYGGIFEIGYVTDLAAWDFHLIKSSRGQNEIGKLVANWYTDANSPDSCYLVFQMKEQQYLDGTCYFEVWDIQELKPAEIPSNIVFSNIGRNSIDVDWTYSSDSADFEVSYFNYFDTSYVMANGTTHITLSNLMDYRYGVSVRMISDSDTSSWSEEAYFILDHLDINSKNLHTELVSDTSVYVYWNPQWIDRFLGEDTISEYILQYYNWPIFDSTIHLSPNNTCYYLTNLETDISYTLKVSAVVGNDTIQMCDNNIRFKTDAIEPNRLIGGNRGDEKLLITGSRFSVSQTYYPSSGVVGLDSLTGVAYLCDGNSHEGLNRNIKIFVGYSDDYILLNRMNCLDTSEMTVVFRGIHNFKRFGWDTIMFDQSIAINHNKNIVICICDSTTTGGADLYFKSHYGYTLAASPLPSYEMPNEILYSRFDWVHYESPDISFVGTPNNNTCRNPRINRITPGPSSLSYAWDKIGTETSWTVNYRMWGDSLWTVSEAQTNQQNVTINNLIPGVTYEVRIGSLTGQDTLYTYSMDIPNIDIFPVPYVETFANGDINTLWKTSEYAEIDGAYAYYGTPGLFVLNPSGYVILPEFNAPINELTLSLYLNDSSECSTVIVGVCSDRSGFYTFEPVDTIFYDRTVPQVLNTAYFDNYTGTGKYLAFQSIKGLIFFDSLRVDFIPDCAIPRHLAVRATGTDSINVVWQSKGSEQNWKVTILPVGDDPSTAQSFECDVCEASFANLQPNTLYNISVQAVCGNSLSEPISITTKTFSAEPLSLPFICDFSDSEQNSKWTCFNFHGNAPWTKTPHNFDTMMYIRCRNPYIQEETGAIAYVPIKVDNSGIYNFSFDNFAHGDTYFTRLYAALAPANVDFDEISYVEYALQKLDNWIMLTKNQYEPGELQTYSMNSFIPEGTYYLTFVYLYSYRLTYDVIPFEAMFDNIVFDYAPCAKVENAQSSSVTTNSAFLSWNSDYRSSEGWQVSIDNGQTFNTDEPYIDVDNLNPSTNYTAEIRSRCNTNNLGKPVSVSFSTKCDVINQLPYFNNFDVEANGDVPHCWNLISGDIVVNNGILDCRINDSNNCIFSLPVLADNIDFNNTKLVFSVKNIDYPLNNLSIALTNDIYDEENYNWISNVSLPEQVNHHSIDLSQYESARYVIFKIDTFDTYYYGDIRHVYFDNIGILPTNVCDYPVQPSVGSIGWNYIQVNWNADHGQSQWEIMITDMNDQPIQVTEVSQPTYTFSNLTPGSSYKVKLRTICNEAPYEIFNYGEWQSISVTTNCGIVSDIHISDITSNSAKVSWTPLDNQNYWNVLYGPSGCYPDHLEELIAIDAYHPEVMLTNLVEGTTYDVYVKAICSSDNTSMSMPVYFTANNGGVNIDAIQGSYSFDIYPNPTSGHTSILINGVEGLVNILVVDINGRTLMQQSLECNNQNEHHFDLTGLPHGTYFVKVVGNQINSVRKLVVK